MKVLATFDGSRLSEATLPQLSMIARLPTAEFRLLAVAHSPHDRLRHSPDPPSSVGGEFSSTTPMVVDAPDPALAESKGQAIDRRRSELEDYLHGIAARIGAKERTSVEARVSDRVADAIIDAATKWKPDVIVMATRSQSGIRHALFGSTTEEVVRSGVSPVLLVHPARD